MTAERPRVLLVPTLTEIEWKVAALIAEWAEVATFDVPGVGDEPAAEKLTVDAIVGRGLEEVDARGWLRYVVAGDEHGAFAATRLAAARPQAVAGLALGHACLEYRATGDRAPINGEVMSAFARLATVDYPTYVRHLTQLTQDAYDDELANEYLRRVPHELTLELPSVIAELASEPLEPLLRNLGVPLFLVKHEGCLGWTDEGYEDAVAAFPEAATLTTANKSSTDPDFATGLRAFCEGHTLDQ
jgi:pimeloyl-ACP methyl ester carboxylesterase